MQAYVLIKIVKQVLILGLYVNEELYFPSMETLGYLTLNSSYSLVSA